MATRAGLCLILIFSGARLSAEFPRELIAWNVGQGQWVTLAGDAECRHFDAGGEFAPWRAIADRCRGLNNLVTLSHWDLDHVGFAARLAKALTHSCLLKAPVGAAPARKARLIAGYSKCRDGWRGKTWVDPVAENANARSRVTLIAGVLITGDAPRTAERRFVGRFTGLRETRWLVLGHHGSRTSTSVELLNRLPRLRGAIASARSARYGHPHPEVRDRLTRAKIPLITTEDWGNIHVRL